jgi:hypothetical protein
MQCPVFFFPFPKYQIIFLFLFIDLAKDAKWIQKICNILFVQYDGVAALLNISAREQN